MRRFERVALLLCVLAGCASEYDLEWELADRPDVGSDELPHLFGRVDAPWVSLSPPDLFTSTGETPPMINFSGTGTTEVHDILLAEPGRVRLTTYPEGETVATMPFDESLMSGSIYLLPQEPLQDRWYALRIDVDGSVLGTSVVDGVQMARFRPDSYAIVQEAVAADRIGRRIIDLRFSERVGNGTHCDDWAISDDAGPLPCRCIGPLSPPGHRAVWLCERREQGTLHIDMGSVPRNVLGVPLRNLAGETISAVDLVATGVSYPGGGIQYR